MKIIKTSILFVLFILIVTTISNAQDYNIQLKIVGLDYDTAVIAFMSEQNNDDEIEDMAIISNGQLNYKFNSPGLHVGVIVPFSLIHKFEGGNKFDLPSSRIRFYFNSGDTIKIDAVVKDKTVTYKTSGNNLSAQLAEHADMLHKSGLYHDRIEFEYQFYKKNQTQWTKDDWSQYWEKRNEYNRLYTEISEKFISEHPHYEYSPRLILGINDKLKATTLYEQLTAESKNSHFGKVLGNMINGWAITSTGVLFPDFSAKTLTGKDFKLNDYKGKYVLLDFWGSWCAPCINEIPELKKLKTEFDKKLVIVGVICNDSKQKISKTAEKYKIDWVQLFDEENAFPDRYGIRAYPTKVLIDEKGFVIKSFDYTSEQLFTELRELLK